MARSSPNAPSASAAAQRVAIRGLSSCATRASYPPSASGPICARTLITSAACWSGVSEATSAGTRGLPMRTSDRAISLSSSAWLFPIARQAARSAGSTSASPAPRRSIKVLYRACNPPRARARTFLSSSRYSVINCAVDDGTSTSHRHRTACRRTRVSWSPSADSAMGTISLPIRSPRMDKIATRSLRDSVGSVAAPRSSASTSSPPIRRSASTAAMRACRASAPRNTLLTAARAAAPIPPRAVAVRSRTSRSLSPSRPTSGPTTRGSPAWPRASMTCKRTAGDSSASPSSSNSIAGLAAGPINVKA